MAEEKREKTKRANTRKLIQAEFLFILALFLGLPTVIWLDARHIVSLAISSRVYPALGLVGLALLFGCARHLHVGLFEKSKVPTVREVKQ